MSDVFISYASEDRERFVEPLVTALRERGIDCWYDQEQIRIGDDFRRRMDDGLAHARFGVIVLSPRYFKYWTEAELSAFLTQEAAYGATRVLPVRCDIDHLTLVNRSPLLASRASVAWDEGVAVIADRIAARVREQRRESLGPQSPVYGLPPLRAVNFVGRETDLETLEKLLEPGQSVRVTASIEGLAGVGKTELALQLAARLSRTDRFPGGIFWCDAENPDLTVVWGTTFADARAVGPGTPVERAAAAVRAASNGPNVLVILDNVEEWTSKNAPRPLPDGPNVALLVTTRRRSLGGNSFQHHTLEVLSDRAANELLVSVAGRDLKDARELLDYLGGHSLAIELAGAYLRDFPQVTPRQYLQKLEEGAPVEEKVKDQVRYENTVNNALDIQCARLDDAAREALLVAACFAPEEASLDLLKSCGVDTDLQQPLRRHHLIGGDDKSWRMHRLVRAWAVQRSTAEELKAAERRFVEGCVEFSRGINIREGFRVYRSDGPHMELATRQVQEILGTNDDRVSTLLNQLGAALYSGGEYRKAKELLERALNHDVENLGESHSVVATRRSNLALIYQNLGNLHRAQELLELALQSDLRNLGENHPSVATLRSNLALVLKDLGDLPRAKELLELALQSDLHNLGENHPSVATSRSNLALVLKDLRDLPRAKELLELALQSDFHNLGENHPSVATRRFNLATIERKLGNWAEARTLFEATLAAYELSLGAEHPWTAFTRASLAEVLVHLSETFKAQEEIERALHDVAGQPPGSRYRTSVERLAKAILGDDI